MTSTDVIADALALAFLAGSWTRSGLCDRAREVLGEAPRWLVPLVRHVLVRFPSPPNDAYETLAKAIREARSFKRGCAPGQPRYALAKLVVGEASMGDNRWSVPPLSTTVDLASWLNLTPAELDWFADIRGLNAQAACRPLCHYTFHWLRKRRGGYRLVEAPKSRLKALQRRVLHEILDRVPAHAAAHGFVGGRSALTAARPHAGRAVLLRLDLEEFFPSVGAPRVYRLFRSFGYPEPVARALTGLCTSRLSPRVLASMPRPDFAELHDDAALKARERTRRRLIHRHLAQGAPTSPALANLAAYPMDVRLAGAAYSAGACYTRYADDLTFSGDTTFARRSSSFEVLVAAIAIEEGFRVNHHKSRRTSRAQSQRVLGLVTNDRPNVPRAERERIEAILTNVLRRGLESENRERDPRFLESLRGHVGWIEHVNPAHARKLRRLLAACEAAAAEDEGAARSTSA